jgi:hypothetical protein
MEVLTPSEEVLFRNERLGDMYLDGVPTANEGEAGYASRRMRLADERRFSQSVIFTFLKASRF